MLTEVSTRRFGEETELSQLLEMVGLLSLGAWEASEQLGTQML